MMVNNLRAVAVCLSFARVMSLGGSRVTWRASMCLTRAMQRARRRLQDITFPPDTQPFGPPSVVTYPPRCKIQVLESSNLW